MSSFFAFTSADKMRARCQASYQDTAVWTRAWDFKQSPARAKWLDEFLKFSHSLVVISHRWVDFVIRAQGHNSVPVLCLAPDMNKMSLFVSV